MNFYNSFFVIIVFGNVSGRSFPTTGIDFEPITSNEISEHRTSLDDCVVRYSKYAPSGLYAGGAFGAPTKFKEFPHMAAVGWTLENGTIVYDCGGSLISEEYILTAGHCTLRASQPPDTVRVGDINLNSEDDDEHVQHIKVAEVIRHPLYKFTSRYNDIALLKLEKPVSVDHVVCPACLFTDDLIEYEKLVATGWGDTGFGEKKSDILLKFTLAPVSLTDCKESYPGDRYLKQGLVEHQFCAFDTKMDTCSGDSGGPLGVKLVSDHRLIPFVVGVTSFGAACGLGTPGVYIKVASFIPWIESVVGISFDPHECTLRNIERREELPDFVRPLTVKFGGYKSSNQAFVGTANSQDQNKWYCEGSLVSEDYVITSASCLELTTPNIIEIGNAENLQSFSIKRIVKHPQFQKSSLEHNIALIQLEKNAVLSQKIYPTCVWTNEILPNISVDAIGQGPPKLHGVDLNDTTIADLDVIINFDTTDLCTKKTTKKSEFCAGHNKYYLVPRICNLKHGSVLERVIQQRNEKLYNYVFGIYSHGKDCGFGKPAVFTRLSSYVGWMETVMFSKTQPLIQKEDNSSIDQTDNITFVDEYRKPDSCVLDNGVSGSCVILYRCRGFLNSASYASAVFCNSGNQRLICCPKNLVD